MSATYQQAIRDMEQELQELDKRRGLIVPALEGLRFLAGEPIVRDRIAAAPRALKTRTNERTNERSKDAATSERSQEPP